MSGKARAAQRKRSVWPGATTKRISSMGIEQFIDNEVKSNDVVLFMKGTPQFPQCGFSGQVVQILDYVGAPYKGINVLESDKIREMFQAGELQQVLKEKGVAGKVQA